MLGHGAHIPTPPPMFVACSASADVYACAKLSFMPEKIVYYCSSILQVQRVMSFPSYNGQVACYELYITLPHNAAATSGVAEICNATGHLLTVAPLMPAWEADDVPNVR
jgi:hypothetical protein